MFSHNSTKLINLSVLKFSLFCLLFFTVNACSNDQTVYGYVVTKIEQGNQWQPVMRVTFRVGDDKVISEVAGLLDEYQDCAIENKHNWECRYQDDRGTNKFGFTKGKYWNTPGWGSDIKYVSRWEYNLIRCKWYRQNSGAIKGTKECLRTLI